MKHSLRKDVRRRQDVACRELERRLYQSLRHDLRLPDAFRYSLWHRLHALPASSSVVQVKNRCHLTGRARSVLRRFRLSRICFRALASQGRLPGIIKASW